MLSQISCCPNLLTVKQWLLKYCCGIIYSVKMLKLMNTRHCILIFCWESSIQFHIILSWNDNRPFGVTESLMNKMPFTLKYKTSSEQETYSLFHSNVIILYLQLGRLSSSQATRTTPKVGFYKIQTFKTCSCWYLLGNIQS